MSCPDAGKRPPEPYTGEELGLVALWPMDASDPRACVSGHGLATEWVGPGSEVALTTPWPGRVAHLLGLSHLEAADHEALHGQEFTFEAWVAFSQMPGAAMTIAELAGPHGSTWRLALSRHLELDFTWADGEGRTQRVNSIQMVDLLRPNSWIHVAVAFRNHCYTAQPYIQSYSRVHLYCTPAGERFPRTVGQLRAFEHPQASEQPATLYIGSGHAGQSPWIGAIAQAALTSRAKLDNEFATLGQGPPRDLPVTDDFLMGSAFCPVERGPNSVVVGCTPYTGSGNYWFYARVDGRADGPVRFEVLPVPGGAGMLMGMFVSYDQQRWERLPNGHYVTDRQSPWPGAYAFAVEFECLPAWLATLVPYTTDDIAALERDLAGHPCVEAMTVGHSVEGRPIRLLKITDPNVPDRSKRTVFMQAGQHSPAEMAPGRCIDRAVRHLASSDPAASALLRDAVFLMVPIVNVDCCAHAGSGMNANRVNTNRDWVTAAQPEVAGIKAFLQEWLAGGRSIDLALDFHAGGAWKNHVVLAIDEASAAGAASPDWFAAQERFLAALEAHTGIGREDAQHRAFIAGTFAQALADEYGVLALCVEFSHMTYRDLDGSTRPVTQAHLESLGPKLVRACAEWLAPD